MWKGLALLLLVVAVGHAQYGPPTRTVNRGRPARYQGENQATSRQYSTTTTAAPKIEVDEAVENTYAPPPAQPPRSYNAAPLAPQPLQYVAAAVAPTYVQPAPVQYQQKQAVPQNSVPAYVQYQEKPTAPKVEQVNYQPQQRPAPVQVAVYSAPVPAVPVTQRPIPVPVSAPKAAAVIYKDARTEEPDINTIPGEAGKDYPIYSSIPKTSFSCSGKIAGYYADVEAGCQAWHYCSLEGLVDSFLCTNGTVYSQENRVCDWWFNVDCSQTSKNYDVNKDLYIIPSSTKAPGTVVKGVEAYAPVPAAPVPVKLAVEQRPVSYDAPEKVAVTVYEVPSYPAPAAPQTPPPAPAAVSYKPETPRQQRVRPAQQQRYQQQQQAAAQSSY